jgi:hypothetical protein
MIVGYGQTFRSLFIVIIDFLLQFHATVQRQGYEGKITTIDAVQTAREMPLADKAGAPEGNQNAVKIETGDKNNVDNINIDFKPKQDRGETYLLRRLARDYPEALDRIQAGEITTRKAAIEYGIIKVKTPMQIDNSYRNWQTG